MGYPWWVGALIALPIYGGIAAVILYAYRLERANRAEVVRRIRARGLVVYVAAQEEWMDGAPGEGICLGGFLPPRGDETVLA